MSRLQVSIFALVALLVICYHQALAKAEQDINKIEWWKKTNFYHIYVKSFRDTNGNGEGDLQGVIEKLDYLKSIGVETLLLSPFYSSPMKDVGYDIDDYTAIDYRFGTMKVFEDLMKQLKERKMRLVVDFVPNHSSNLHKWFKCSERALIEPERCGKYKDYYLWSNSTRYNQKYPNNWISLFGGGPAWRWSDIRKEYYFHQFLPEQPDLNMRNPLVREEFKEIARFWLRKGVDGLRVDAVLHLLEDIQMRDEPEDPMWEPHWDPYDRLLHIYTRSRSESATVVRDWYEVAKEPEFIKDDKLIIIEAYDSIQKLLEYYGPNETFRYSHMPFDFELFALRENNLRPNYVEKLVTDWMNATRALGWPDENGAISPWSCWVTGNHDNKRIVNRVGDLQADAYKYITYLIPGSPVSYYGDEIGMYDAKFDSIPVRTRESGEPTRLIFRSAMAWTAEEPSGGFSSSADPWMPLNENYKQNNVAELSKAPGKNHLKNFVQLQKVRKENIETVIFGDLVFFKNQPDHSQVFAMARTHPKFGNLLLLINFNNQHDEVVHLSESAISVLDLKPTEPPTRAKVIMLNKVVEGSQLVEGLDILGLTGLVLAPSQAVLLKY